MLAQLTNQQLMDLASLAQQPRWERVNDIIEAEIAASVQRLIDNSDAAVLHELRGRIKGLRDFQSEAREAMRTLEKKGLRAPL